MTQRNTRPDTAPVAQPGDRIPPWPPHACTDDTAAPPVTIIELDRRRRAYFRLEEYLGRRVAA